MKIREARHSVVCFLEKVLLEMIPLIFHFKSTLKQDENHHILKLRHEYNDQKYLHVLGAIFLLL